MKSDKVSRTEKRGTNTSKLKSTSKDKSSEHKIYDIVVFGATGFTGQLTAEYLARHQQHNKNLRWAIAGRSREALTIVKQCLLESNKHCESLGIIVANVGNQDTLDAMARSTKVLISTVGPYIHYGEPVVKACIENNCHYVDLTGEPEFVDTIRHHYHLKAKERKVKIVNSCGFDSIPYDLGALFSVLELKKLFPDDEQKSLDIELEGMFRSSGSFSGGTWHSAITAFSRVREYNQKKKQWRQLDAPLNRSAVKKREGRSTEVGSLPSRIRYRKDLGTWLCPLPTIDPQVVKRSASLRGDYGRSFRYGHYLQLKKLTTLVGGTVAVAGVFALAQFRPSLNLLLKIKNPGEGPSEAERNRSWFKVIMQAKANGQSVHTHVSGGDPGYGETSKMLAESALCLAFDEEQLRAIYGVVTPSAAMGESLIKRLQAAGIVFSLDYRSTEGEAVARDSQVA